MTNLSQTHKSGGPIFVAASSRRRWPFAKRTFSSTPAQKRVPHVPNLGRGIAQWFLALLFFTTALHAQTVVKLTLAQSDASKVEPNHRQSKRRERLHRVIDNLVMHRPTAKRMRMADERGIRSIFAARIQYSFKPARWPPQIIDRSNM